MKIFKCLICSIFFLLSQSAFSYDPKTNISYASTSDEGKRFLEFHGCKSKAEVETYCGKGSSHGCVYRGSILVFTDVQISCYACAAPGTPGNPDDSENPSCPAN